MAQILQLQLQRQQKQTRMMHRNHRGHGTDQTKRYFAVFRTKYQDNTVIGLTERPASLDKTLAGILQDDWTSIIRRELMLTNDNTSITLRTSTMAQTHERGQRRAEQSVYHGRSTPGDETLQVWESGWTPHPDPVTNNLCEYQALLRGLQQADRIGFGRITVIGDSLMIIRQQNTRRLPKASNLRSYDVLVRLLTDGVGVTEWIHHFRTNNKMADTLANGAMDHKASQAHHGVPPVIY